MPRFGRSYFADATGRLAKAFGLLGEIPVDLGETITPVISVADGTSPGMNLVRGRRFAAPIVGNPGAAGYSWFRATQEVVIERIHIWNTAGTASFYIVDPTNIEAAALTWANVGGYTERQASPSDVPPFQQATTYVAPGAGTFILLSNGQTLSVAAQPALPEVWPTPIMLSVGGGIVVYFSAAAGKGWMSGYVF